MLNSRCRVMAILAAAAGVALATVPVLALAEDLGAIVVTARKRAESFQSVPVTMDVFTEKNIQAAGIEKPGDFIAMVPNMNLVETQNAGTSFVVLRGISQARNSEPSVAVVVDGVLETNPAAFNQELLDIKQIEVLKGPQGALYGRDAIGGAIIIHTRGPTDHFEGHAAVGIGNGTSEKALLALSGPMNESRTLKYRAAFNVYNTDGFLENTYLHQKADPARDYTGRARFLWTPNDALTADLRFAVDRLETRGFYFVVPRANEANPFSTFTTPPDANNTNTPITVNNPGEDNRDLWSSSLKVDYDTRAGVVSSITAFDKTKEIITGDAFDFRPRATSIFQALFGTDLNQSQYLNVKSYSQELRFTSKPVAGFSWIGGLYFVHTDRFISTGNMVDTGAGVFPVYEQPRSTGPNPSFSFLADTQSNDAWAAFADATYDVTKKFQVDVAARYDQDHRNNTTNTPTQFLPDPSAYTGEVRTHTWSELQPKGTLRYMPTDNWTIYGGWSRGFRSGGFNQTGVGAVARANNILGVNDEFNAEVADTWEIGVKSQWLDRRVDVGVSLFDTKSRNGYFFVFLAANSTQNLGNLDATYKGGEVEINAKATDHLNLYASYGYTGSRIDRMADPTVIGNQAPLVSRTTTNAGLEYNHAVWQGLNGTARVDFQRIGRTWWDPYNVTSRDPVNLVDMRLGLDKGQWSLTAWSKNLTDTKYNTEFSPGGFLWKGLPRRYGIEFDYKF